MKVDSGSMLVPDISSFASLFPVTFGAEIGEDDFRISDMGETEDKKFNAFDPSIAYNFLNNEYLVVWKGDDFVDNQFEIYGQRINAETGIELGENDLQISNIFEKEDRGSGLFSPSLAYNSTNNEYLVVWSGYNSEDKTLDIFGQRIDATTGNEIGEDDFRISNMGINTDTTFNDAAPSIVYNLTNNEYLVVWSGNKERNGEFEIYGQRLDGDTGLESGPNDFVITSVGIDGSNKFKAVLPSVTYNTINNEYLVAWSGNETIKRKLLLGLRFFIPEFNIYGQRLDASTGNEIGEDDFLIGQVNNEPLSRPMNLSTIYNADNNEFLVVWNGELFGSPDSLSIASVETGGIFAQRIDARTGKELGKNDFRINGPGDNHFGPKVVYNSQENEYFVTWLIQNSVINDNGLNTTAKATFCQRIDSNTGKRKEECDIQLSRESFVGFSPAVYISTNNEYLTVWSGESTDDPGIGSEIFGQRFKP